VTDNFQRSYDGMGGQLSVVPTVIQEGIDQIQGLDQEDGDKPRQALINLELEDNSREREDELSSDLFRDALNTSLRVSAQGSEATPQLKPRDPAAAQADPERAEWIFPAADELPGGEQSWGDVLDALRRPRQPGEKLWDWRRNTVPQPVVFKDPKEVNADRVYLHLDTPWCSGCSTASWCAGPGRGNQPGHGAARLHDEVLELVAEWDPADPARRLRVLNATQTDLALADLEISLRERLPAVDEAI
jgi:hypothetical protein